MTVYGDLKGNTDIGRCQKEEERESNVGGGGGAGGTLLRRKSHLVRVSPGRRFRRGGEHTSGLKMGGSDKLWPYRMGRKTLMGRKDGWKGEKHNGDHKGCRGMYWKGGLRCLMEVTNSTEWWSTRGTWVDRIDFIGFLSA